MIGVIEKAAASGCYNDNCLPSLPWYGDGVACAAPPEGDFNANKTSICVYRCLDCLMFWSTGDSLCQQTAPARDHGATTPNVAVGSQYDTTHVYVTPHWTAIEIDYTQ
jgi:hypothetical protein